MKTARSNRLLITLVLLSSIVTGSSQTSSPTERELFGGLHFRSIGPANMSGRFVDIAVVESDPYIFYSASATGGVWKTINNGVTFTPVFEKEATHSVGDIAVHQSQPNIVWVGTGERANRQSSSWGDGVYKSVDAGATWTNMGLRESRHIGRIILHPNNPDVVYVAAMGHLWGDNPERGLYRTMDGGETWDRILFIDSRTGVVDVAMDPDEPQILYAASYQRQRKAYGFHGGGPGSALFKSTDGGDTWKKLTQGLPEGDWGRIGISVYRRDPRIVYICLEQGERYTASTSYEERKAGIYRSEDRGESWTLMSDWNPRPMYASQILVDPNDDQRIYMENAFSYSEDGGKTFTVPRQSVHSDDRFLWVNPADSRHLIKASDGALAISYDRAKTWLLVRSLPVSQYYRVSVDMADPFRIYGGLQDNGSWMGPSATYRSEGILNEDWIRLGGGDGFLNLVDPTDPGKAYVESQYLGLTYVDLVTLEKRAIRPGNTSGWIQSRRNWDTWGTDLPVPPLGNQISPANWDGPFLISPHNSHILYAGTQQLWKTSDRGQHWTPLGDLTSGVDRSRLTIMDQMPNSSTPSLDDGVPFYPTLSAIAESPLREGLLYVGANDGTLSRSSDGGKSWESIASRLPGLPDRAFFSSIEASRFHADTVYAAVNNYRNDDYSNYLYRSDDSGASWRLITGDLPPDRVIRVVREDPRNPAVLYAATEFGVFVTTDSGQKWHALKNNLPTLAVNDLVVHPRDNDLVLGTHGRGIWILDDVQSVQEMSAEVMASPAHLFSIEPARMIRRIGEKAQEGDMVFRGENPPSGAIIDYYLASQPSEDQISLTVHDAEGKWICDLEATRAEGVNRVIWDLRFPRLPDPVGEEPGRSGRQPRGPVGPLVVPGQYRVRLQVAETVSEQWVDVSEDPRIQLEWSERATWTAHLQRIGALYRAANTLLEELLAKEDQPAELEKEVRELRRRLLIFLGEVSGWTGGLTDDQKEKLLFLAGQLDRLRSR